MTPERLVEALADRYHVVRELAQGGMATVYLADDLRHRRKVAIKVLRPELAAEIGAERFLLEIETTAGLRHPHILPLYDSGDADGFLFYVMPYVEGESLRDRLTRERQLPIADALSIVGDVASALGYAHARGIVHRDIKPENILLESGHAVVADYGIARALSAAAGPRLTQTGLAVGTPQYMSPEQVAGESDVDGRSDLYSLGCVLYEMLGGQPPFTGPTAASIVRQHLLTDPPLVTDLRAAVPAELASAVSRALSKNRVDRFSGVEAFVRVLSAGAASESPPARPARRTRTRIALAAFTLAVVLTLAWFGARLRRGGDGRDPIDIIAVLPLENQTGDAGQDFFSEGMTRELIGVLTDAGVRVLGYRAVSSYRGSDLPAGRIAQELRVDAIVAGAVLHAGAVVQVAAELTDPGTGESLWAGTFSRPAPDVLTLQHEVALEIARGIRARLTTDQQSTLAPARSVNPEAYAEYLLGQQQAALRTPDGFVRSVDHLHRSLALDSTFAPAWATLSMTNAYGLLYQLTPRDSGRAVIERTASLAIALDDRLADPWFARGVALLHADWDFAAAEEAFLRGLERNGSTEARGLWGWTLWETGRFGEAIAATQELIAVEPTTAQWRSDVAWSYWSSGDSAAARASLLRAIEVDSTFYEAYDLLGMVESDAGNLAASQRSHERAIDVAGGDYWVRQFSEAVLYRARDDIAGVRRVLAELEGDPRYAQRAVMSYLAGEEEETYALLERAIATRDGDVLWVLSSIPYLYPLHGEDRFQELVRRVGLPDRQ